MGRLHDIKELKLKIPGVGVIQAEDTERAEAECTWDKLCGWSEVNEKQSKSKSIESLQARTVKDLGGHYEDWILKYLSKVLETAHEITQSQHM